MAKLQLHCLLSMVIPGGTGKRVHLLTSAVVSDFEPIGTEGAAFKIQTAISRNIVVTLTSRMRYHGPRGKDVINSSVEVRVLQKKQNITIGIPSFP